MAEGFTKDLEHVAHHDGGIVHTMNTQTVIAATYGAGKTAALQKGVPGAKLWGAFGDSVFDLAMLRAARIRVAVRPKPELRRQAAACPGLIEILRAP